MKQRLYVGLFVLLGLLFQQLLHGVIERSYIALLLSDFDRWSFGASWHTFFTAHTIFTATLVLGGAILGFISGRYWWVRLYDENGRLRPEFQKRWRV